MPLELTDEEVQTLQYIIREGHKFVAFGKEELDLMDKIEEAANGS